MKLYYILGLWNIVTFLIMGIDKYKSIHHKQRIRESVIVAISIVMGAAGCILGSSFFKHKTQKLKFKIVFPLSLVLNILVVIYYKHYFIIT